jgi:hypothetical protein
MVEQLPGKPQTRRYRLGSKGGGCLYVVRTLRAENGDGPACRSPIGLRLFWLTSCP